MVSEVLALGPVSVSRLGFGCWQLGGHGWQDLDAQALEHAIRDALQRGMNFFDTADVYGLGHSEEVLGRLLKDAEACVATKFGVRFMDGARVIDNDPAYIRTALDASRTRLGRDCIDLYQLHWPDGKTDIRVVFDELESLRAQGKIRAYGVCNTTLTDWNKGQLPPGLASFSFEYSLVRRDHENAIRYMQDTLGLTFISWGSLAQGLLSGKYARGHQFAPGDVRARPDSLFADKNWNAYEPVLATLQSISQELGQPMSRIALRWILDGMGGITLAGIKNPGQLADNAAAFGWHLPARMIDALNRVSDAQTPL